METKFSVSLAKIISELELDVAYMPNEPEKIRKLFYRTVQYDLIL